MMTDVILEVGLSEAARKEGVESPHEGFFREHMINAIQEDSIVFDDVMEAGGLEDAPTGMGDRSFESGARWP